MVEDIALTRCYG